MSKCCGPPKETEITEQDPSQIPTSECCGIGVQIKPRVPSDIAINWFDDMVPRCIDYAKEQQSKGAKIVGIMCEYTPREIIMAAGGIPVCLCGGSEEMIPAAEEALPANLCPLIKSTYGYSINQANPLLEMSDLLVAETTCDGKKKMYELLAERHPMHVLELPQKPSSTNALMLWVKELSLFKESLEERFGVRITDDALRQAIRDMNDEREKRRQLAALMAQNEPPLTGYELLNLKSLISCMPQDMAKYDEILSALSNRKVPSQSPRPVRVLMTGVPMPHGQERVLRLIEDRGGLVVAQENCTGLKPIYEDIDPDADDPMLAIAEKYFHLPCSVMVNNQERLELLKNLNAQYRPDCVIELIWQACITYDVETATIKRFVEETLKLPYLRIETDYSPSDSARIALRVQALFEMAT